MLISRKPAATARVLIQNLESDPLQLQFSEFKIEYLHQSNRKGLVRAKEFFPEAVYGNSLLEWNFPDIPAAPNAPSGFGAIPFEIEDLLLVLRLYRPGDLAFLAMEIEREGQSPARQYSYRVISPLVGVSTRQFRFDQPDVRPWEEFARALKSCLSWQSKWFEVSRRFFLYGGGKEFNPNYESEVDRVIDYVTALEATLVPEHDFIGRLLRERAVRILGLRGPDEQKAKKLLKEIYVVRSTLVHGSPMPPAHLSKLRDQFYCLEFERILRELIVAALKNVPPNEADRRSYLASLYRLDDATRAEKIEADFKAIKQEDVKRDLLGKLNTA